MIRTPHEAESVALIGPGRARRLKNTDCVEIVRSQDHHQRWHRVARRPRCLAKSIADDEQKKSHATLHSRGWPEHLQSGRCSLRSLVGIVSNRLTGPVNRCWKDLLSVSEALLQQSSWPADRTRQACLSEESLVCALSRRSLADDAGIRLSASSGKFCPRTTIQQANDKTPIHKQTTEILLAKLLRMTRSARLCRSQPVGDRSIKRGDVE